MGMGGYVIALACSQFHRPIWRNDYGLEWSHLENSHGCGLVDSQCSREHVGVTASPGLGFLLLLTPQSREACGNHGNFWPRISASSHSAVLGDCLGRSMLIASLGFFSEQIALGRALNTTSTFKRNLLDAQTWLDLLIKMQIRVQGQSRLHNRNPHCRRPSRTRSRLEDGKDERGELDGQVGNRW